MLRQKILTQILVIQLIVLCLFVGAYTLIYRGYQDLEKRTLETNLVRVTSALQKEIHNLQKYNLEWASSGAIYYSIRNNDAGTVRLRQMFISSIVGAFGISKAVFYDTQGKQLTTREVVDSGPDEAEIASESPFLTSIDRNPRLYTHADEDSSASGLLLAGDDILIVSSEPITMGSFGPGVHGALVTAMPFGRDSIVELQDILRQDLEILPLQQFVRTEANQAIATRLLTEDTDALHLPIDNSTIQTFALLKDIDGNNEFILSIKSNRDIMLQVQDTIAKTGFGLFVSFLFTALYILFFLDRKILRRLKFLNRSVDRLITHDDASGRLTVIGDDELSGLTTAFNNLLGSLERSQLSLKNERDKAETTLASIGDAVITTALDGSIEYVNKTAQRLTQSEPDKYQGQPLTTLFNPVDEDGDSASSNLALRSIQAKRTIRDTEYCHLKTVDGQRLIIESLACPIQDEQGATKGAVIVFRDVSRSRELQKNLIYQASHDSLTGLLNRSEFERQLDIVINAVGGSDQSHHLLFIDLDRFKVVNDSCGHIAGDKVLKELARIMRSSVRQSDAVARIGGDEFAIILMNAKPKDAFDVAEKLRLEIDNYRFTHNGKSFTFGASIGLLNLKDSFYEKDDSPLSMADKACMAAKNAGRNRVHIFQREDIHLAEHHKQTQWVHRITDAIEHDHFELFFQKIVPIDPAKHLPSKAEILLRMIDSDGSHIAPGAFLPAAERYGLMKFIDKWVIEHFCEWAKNHATILKDTPSFAINLSGHSLSDNKFLEYLLDYFKNPVINPAHLCFEITETAAIQNISNAQNFITELKTMGFSFSLDDFGSGMSSFGYLKNLPVDNLKIDGIFVRNIVNEAIDRSMVKSINEIGHVLDIITVAEFVENENILNILRELGVDYAQGYHIHAPESLASLTAHAASAQDKKRVDL